MNISTKFGSKWRNGFRGDKKKTDNPMFDTFVPLAFYVWNSIDDKTFLINLVKSPKQRFETYCFCSISYY